MTLRQFFLIGNILIIGLCSANPASLKLPDARIVGGFETTIEDVPWQVSLLYRSSLRCGGSIIGEKWVLTAAHCTYRISANNLAVRVGSSAHRSGGTIIPLKRFVQQPKYDAVKIDFDFSLLELTEPLSFNDQIQPAPLPEENAQIRDGTECLVSGWGNTHNSSESSERLRAAIVPIFDQNLCNQQYRRLGLPISPRMICAGYKDGGIDHCHGDSGGPLVEDHNGHVRLIGVVSFAKGCAEPNYPGVYARVSSVRRWIESVTGI